MLLVDLQMGEVGGWTSCEPFVASTDCPVILMTAQPSVDTAMEAVKLGAIDYKANRSTSADWADC